MTDGQETLLNSKCDVEGDPVYFFAGVLFTEEGNGVVGNGTVGEGCD